MFLNLKQVDYSARSTETYTDNQGQVIFFFIIILSYLFQVPGKVRSLDIQTVLSQSDSLDVSWVVPIGPCLPDDYTVQYQLTNLEQCDKSGGNKTTFGTITGTSVMITGLEAFSTYDVFVLANNDAGYSEIGSSGSTDSKGNLCKPECQTSSFSSLFYNCAYIHPIRVVKQINYHVIVYHVYSEVQHPMTSVLFIP